MKNTDLLAAVETYFDAIYHCDVEKLDSVFHPTASLFDADEGSILTDPIASFRQDVATRPSPASAGHERVEEVLLMDFLSPKCALVKVRLRAHSSIFVDHLSFVQNEIGEWKIVAKVWHLEGVL